MANSEVHTRDLEQNVEFLEGMLNKWSHLPGMNDGLSTELESERAKLDAARAKEESKPTGNQST